VIYYDEYSRVPARVVDEFVRSQELGRLLTVAAGGLPHIGLYPFVFAGDSIELHLHRADEQLADLAQARRCVFEVDEVLATIPSHWLDAEDAIFATAYHRFVSFSCEATLSTDPAEIAEQQTRLLARYQPEGGFRRVDPEDPLYRANLARIAALRLRVVDCRVKFKLAQNRSPEARRRVVERLRERGRLHDGRAADALQWTIDQEA